MSKVLGFSGHRNFPQEKYDYIYKSIVDYLNNFKPDKTISGGALGLDLLFAVICIRLNIPIIIAVPFSGQESKWSENQKKQYNKILNKASEIITVSDGEYSKEKYQIRNEYIVNNSDEMLIVWNGKPSGTNNCKIYAESKNKTINLIKI